MSILNKAKPALVLCAITTVISTVLIISSSFLPDTSNIIGEKLLNACKTLMGEGEYAIVDDWEAAGYDIAKPVSVNKLIRKQGSDIVAMEISAAGFKPPDGITALVAINPDGSVLGVVPVLIKDTVGYGDRTHDADFLSGFIGKTSAVKIMKGVGDPAENEVMGITGATYSAQGVADAVNTALAVYAEMKR